MQFLRTVFWVALAVVAVIFALANTELVKVHLWGDVFWNPPLWFALLIAFLLGLLPALILHRATRWNLTRKLDAATRAFGASETTRASGATETPPPSLPPETH